MESITMRKDWLKTLKTEIRELRNSGMTDKAIKQQMRQKFFSYSSGGEKTIGFIFVIILCALVGFGIHIGYATLMWEAHIYEFSVNFSPYTSMLIFALLLVVLCGIFIFWLRYFVEFFRFYKILDDTLEEQFYLKLFKMFLLLGLIGFVVFMIMVFFVGLQIAEFYNMPLGSSLLETFMEIVD